MARRAKVKANLASGAGVEVDAVSRDGYILYEEDGPV